MAERQFWALVPPGFRRDFDRGQEPFVAKWESRWGAEAARQIYVFRAVYLSGYTVSMLLVCAALLILAARRGDGDLLYFILASTAIVVVQALMFCSIRPLRRGMEIIRARYRVDQRARMPFKVLSRPEEFDSWVLANRREQSEAMTPPQEGD